jgi:hypothetical protein
VTALKPSQFRTHSSQLRFIPASPRIKQTSALAEREKQKIQLSHSLAEPRPPGIALRRRSKTVNGPRSFVTRWLNLKVASDPKMKVNQRILSPFKKVENPVFTAQSDSGDSRRHDNALGCSWAQRADRSLRGNRTRKANA